MAKITKQGYYTRTRVFFIVWCQNKVVVALKVRETGRIMGIHPATGMHKPLVGLAKRGHHQIALRGGLPRQATLRRRRGVPKKGGVAMEWEGAICYL